MQYQRYSNDELACLPETMRTEGFVARTQTASWKTNQRGSASITNTSTINIINSISIAGSQVAPMVCFPEIVSSHLVGN